MPIQQPPVKKLVLPSGRTFALGRQRPVAPCPRLKLSHYLMQSLPTPPAAIDYSPAAMASLRNIYGNGDLGDCVIAAGGHIRGVTSGNAGSSGMVAAVAERFFSLSVPRRLSKLELDRAGESGRAKAARPVQ